MSLAEASFDVPTGNRAGGSLVPAEPAAARTHATRNGKPVHGRHYGAMMMPMMWNRPGWLGEGQGPLAQNVCVAELRWAHVSGCSLESRQDSTQAAHSRTLVVLTHLAPTPSHSFARAPRCVKIRSASRAAARPAWIWGL